MEERSESKEKSALIPAKKALRERRAHLRYGVYSDAIVHLINTGLDIHGRVLDLSMSGCRIRARERMTVGVYRKIEVEFRLEGQPFRLGGVLQAIHDHQTFGIRFIDMSERKREQLAQLIADIEEERARVKTQAKSNDVSPSVIDGAA